MNSNRRRLIWPTMILGVGIIWILQGLDVFGQDGGMNGDENWIVFGAIAALVGGVLLAVEIRRAR